MRPDDDALDPRPADWRTATVGAVSSSDATVTVDWAGTTGAGVPIVGPPPAEGDVALVLVDDGVPVVAAGPFVGTLEWTPTLTAATTDPTLGTGSTRRGRITRVGHLAIVSASVVFGTSGVSAGSGAYRVSLPVQPSATWALPRGRALGTCALWDASTTTLRHGFVAAAGPDGSQYLNLWLGDGSQVAHNVPWTWAASDEIHVQVVYGVGASP